MKCQGVTKKRSQSPSRPCDNLGVFEVDGQHSCEWHRPDRPRKIGRPAYLERAIREAESRIVAAAKEWDASLDAEHVISFASEAEIALIEAVQALRALEGK